MTTTISGLPAHILLVHVVVVLLPLTAIALVVAALWPAARRRLAVPTFVLAVVAVGSVPLATQAGEWLERRLPRTELLAAHTHIGDSITPWAAGLGLMAFVVAAREVLARRAARADGPGTTRAPQRLIGGTAATVVIAVLVVVVAAGTVWSTYRIGDSGARAAWEGTFSEQPLPGGMGPGGPPPGG